MTTQESFGTFDAEAVIENAIRKYWQCELDRGVEVIPYDDLDPAKQRDLRETFYSVSPHVIRALREAMASRRQISVEVPDVIPDYFFNNGDA